MKEDLFNDIDGVGFSDEAELVQLVGLKLGDEEYAIDVLKIQEIIRSVEITVVPRMDNYILGVMNLRGKVIPVIDLRIRFNLDKSDFDKATRIIVVRFEKQNIGFVVDEVTEVIRIKKSMVEPTPPLVGSIGQEYILGICRYDARLIMLLDIDRVINESSDPIESELRKKMLGNSRSKNTPFVPPVHMESAPAPQAAPVIEPIQKEESLPAPDKVPAPTVTAAPHKDEGHDEAIRSGSADADVEGGIDDLIARELAKREAETDELNKKKRSVKESPEDVLGDAMKQSAAIFDKGAEGHVVQDDLDSLIAKELAKREAETEELNQKHREDKKKNDLSVDLSVVDPNAVPKVEIVSHGEKGDLASVSEVLREGDAKAEHPETAQKISIKELKSIVEKILSGEKPEELNLDVKGEIGELLRLVIDTKTKVDEIDPMLEASKSTLPHVTSVLKDVNKSTEKATVNLMDASNDMSSFYNDFIKNIADLKALAVPGKEKDFEALHKNIWSNLSRAEDLGFRILESLEFQDITEQKLRKVINSIEDMGGRIGAIIGYLHVKHSGVSDAKRMDKLLSDYGLV